MVQKDESDTRQRLSLSRPADDTLLVVLSGRWKVDEGLPSADEVAERIESDPRIRRVTLETQGLTEWDSGLLTFLIKLTARCSQRDIGLDQEGLPQGVRRLLALASAVPEPEGGRKETIQEGFFTRVGQATLEAGRSAQEMLAFVGEAFLAFLKFLAGRANLRRSDLTLIMQQCGFQALPIVSVLSLLVGMILGFLGAIQLKLFGAEIYVADLVGIGMVRLMSPIITGIIMAGRTGAAFAAHLGTMQVNEEIDALKTLGVSPMEFLVVPRMVALVSMMPLLCVYADLLGILGGLLVGLGMPNISFTEYMIETRKAVTLTHFWIGIFQGVVFAALVALAGCLRGLQCGRSASAVGDAATSAVVTAIVAIVVATAIITFVCNVLGI
jgi:phospholipid/cholesterol/gamma-HCH transport system permease protein